MRYSRLLMALLVVPFAACDDDEVTPPANEPADVITSGTAFSPASLVLTPDDTIAGGEGTATEVSVVWQFNAQGGPHNVTFEDGTPGSGDKTTGTFERDFPVTPGTYRYRCTNHSSDFTTGMVGMVVVQ